MNDSGPQEYRLIDWPALVAKFDGDATIASGLLGIAQRSSATMPADLRAAAVAGDMDGMARLAHKLKGTAGDICAPALREQALTAELAARAAAPESAAAARALADALDELLQELQASPAATS